MYIKALTRSPSLTAKRTHILAGEKLQTNFSTLFNLYNILNGLIPQNFQLRKMAEFLK